MTAWIIILSVVLVLFILLLLPITVDLSFVKKLSYRIKYAGFVLLNSEKKVEIKKAKKQKRQSQNDVMSKEQSSKKDSFFKKTYKQKGFYGTVKYFSELLMMLLKKLWFVVKHLKFTRFKLDITVATDNAANTAIEYGGICSAVYPILAFLGTNADFKSKEVDISTDFDKTESTITASISVTTRLIYCLIVAVSAIFEFLRLQHKESEKHERKQH